MNQERVGRVIENMKAKGLSQMIISSPSDIFFLTGRLISPGERLLALYLNQNGGHRIYINNLFTVPEDLGVEKVRFSDSDDCLSLLYGGIDHTAQLGIDRNFPARFLLPLVDRKVAAGYVLASDCVGSVRSCKDEAEKELMREASRINDASMAEFFAGIRPGITEQALAESMEKIYRSHGAQGYSFEPLVAFGKNAANGHHAPDDTPLRDGDCVLIDVGCRKDGYCSDMTRTFFFRSASEHAKQIYEIVRSANLAAEAIIKPGVRFCEIDAAARDIIKKSGLWQKFHAQTWPFHRPRSPRGRRRFRRKREYGAPRNDIFDRARNLSRRRSRRTHRRPCACDGNRVRSAEQLLQTAYHRSVTCS